MWVSIAGGLVRTFSAVLAGWLIGQGVDSGSATEIVGALGALAVAGASTIDKIKRDKEK